MVLVMLFSVISAMVIIPAYPTITASHLVMLMGVVMILVMEEVIVTLNQGRGDHLGLLPLVHVNVDGDIIREMAGDQDVDIVDINPHIILGMCTLDLLQRITRGWRVSINPFLRTVCDRDLVGSRVKMKLSELSPPPAG